MIKSKLIDSHGHKICDIDVDEFDIPQEINVKDFECEPRQFILDKVTGDYIETKFIDDWPDY